MWPRVVTNFFLVKPTRCTNFPNLLRHDTLHVSVSSSANHQEFIHCTFSNGICHRSCSKAVFKPVWHIPVPSVQWINSWWWAEDLPEICRASCGGKFRKLVQLIGFIIKKIDGPVCTNYIMTLHFPILFKFNCYICFLYHILICMFQWTTIS
jgi:hypothetical protein